MRTIILLCGLLIGSAWQSAWGQEVGEQIHYNLTQMGIKAGEATLTFNGKVKIKDQETIYIDFVAQGMNFQDHEKIYLDPQRLKPLIVERDLNIFGKKEKIVEFYSQGKLKIVKTVGNKTTEQVIDKAGWMDNIYAFIYRYRQSGKFQINETLSINLPTKDIKIVLVKKDTLTIGDKTYDVLYMQSKPSKYKIWFETSSKKLPVRISGAVGFGNTAMVMKE